MICLQLLLHFGYLQVDRTSALGALERVLIRMGSLSLGDRLGNGFVVQGEHPRTGLTTYLHISLDLLVGFGAL